MNLKELAPHIDMAIRQLKRFISVFLLASSAAMILSVVLVLLYGPGIRQSDSIPGLIIWYSVLGGMFSFFYSLVILLAVFLYYHYGRKMTTWPLIKKEVVLLGILLLCYIVFLLAMFISFRFIFN